MIRRPRARPGACLLALALASGCATVQDLVPDKPSEALEPPRDELPVHVDAARVELVERGRLKPRRPSQRKRIVDQTAAILRRALGADGLGPTLEVDVELTWAARPDSRVVAVRMAATTFLPNGRVVESESALTLVPSAEACIADGLDREALLFVGAALGAFATWSLAPIPGSAGCAVLGFAGAALALGLGSWAAEGLWPPLVLEPRLSNAWQRFLVEHAALIRERFRAPADLPAEDPRPAAGFGIPDAVPLDELGRPDPDADDDGPTDPVETPY